MDACRDREAEALSAELLSLPVGERAGAVREPRFHSAIVLEHLLRGADAAQPKDPWRAVSLATLAGWLAPHVVPGAGGEKALVTAQVEAGNLAGNAFRLLGRWAEAEGCLEAAGGALALFRKLSPERVTWWCYLGLLRWEQGRLDEAEPLLRHAAGSCGALKMPHREAAACSLLGLLCLERGEPDEAVRFFEAGRATRPALAPDRDAWLFARSGLGLAGCLAESGHRARARRVFDETLPLYAPAGEEEQARLRWLEGRLTARLGRRQEAASLLSRAWRLFLEQRDLADATLCFLDLAVVLADAKREPEASALLQEMETELMAGEPFAEIRRAVSTFIETICTSSPKGRKEGAATAAFTVRRLFRARGRRVEALPYA
jgi:tetratricopeptide (TPR) repeat protein